MQEKARIFKNSWYYSLLYPYKIVSIEIIRKKSPIEELLFWAVQKTVKIDC